jgi:hypothetical protein
MTILFANNAASTLASGVSSTTTTLQLISGSGALFPQPTNPGDYFVLTLTDAATGLIDEIVDVTARVGDTLTVVRGQEGTTARSWNAGDFASNLLTAGTLQALPQGNLSLYALLNSPTFTGTPAGPTPTTSDSSTKLATTAFVKNQSYATQTFVTSQGYITSAALSGYATQTYVNSQGFITASALSGYATQTYVNSQGFVNGSYVSSALAPYATESWVLAEGYITAAALSPYATTSYVTSQGFVNGGYVSSAITAAFNSNFGSPNGYIVLNSGMIFQWGSFAASLGGSGTVSYPISFPNVSIGIVGTPTSASGSNNSFNINVSNNSTFTWGWPSTTGGSYGAHYWAWGY